MNAVVPVPPASPVVSVSRKSRRSGDIAVGTRLTDLAALASEAPLAIETSPWLNGSA